MCEIGRGICYRDFEGKEGCLRPQIDPRWEGDACLSRRKNPLDQSWFATIVTLRASRRASNGQSVS